MAVSRVPLAPFPTDPGEVRISNKLNDLELQIFLNIFGGFEQVL